MQNLTYRFGRPGSASAILGLLILLALSPVAAADCRINPDILGAFYQIEKQPGPKGDTLRETLELWRLHSEVAHVRPERSSTEIWRLGRSGEVAHSRYNDALKLQEPVQARDDVLWPAKYQLLPREALDKMQRVEVSGEGCKRVEKYRLELDSGRLTIWWNPELRLVMLLDRQGAAASTTMKLTAIEGSGPVVAKMFNSRRDYLPVDSGKPALVH